MMRYDHLNIHSTRSENLFQRWQNLSKSKWIASRNVELPGGQDGRVFEFEEFDQLQNGQTYIIEAAVLQWIWVDVVTRSDHLMWSPFPQADEVEYHIPIFSIIIYDNVANILHIVCTRTDYILVICII